MTLESTSICDRLNINIRELILCLGFSTTLQWRINKNNLFYQTASLNFVVLDQFLIRISKRKPVKRLRGVEYWELTMFNIKYVNIS